ncbi:hypothetical protein JTE90_022643 [Oedothorax gibbosus]|uniref:DNA-directed RNA polymerase n=1 Tax=Oedothorax gibbosus TaxID=931172 RepID=A0AAV6TUT6_9ARAC|nr:hypothetical protein JTE90_022643 [Oedothorax gibbosus]
MIQLLITWRKHHAFGSECLVCSKRIPFPKDTPYATCCEKFYYNSLVKSYPVQSIAIPTPGYFFGLPILKRMIAQAKIETNQDFLVLPDPIYWQVPSTLIYEKVIKFVQGLPITSKTKHVLPKEKTDVFYKQIIEAPLNYGSMQRRSCGKNTLIRQVAFGKRCNLSMRGMIVPDAQLRPNQIRLPAKIVKMFQIQNQWIILNRMPSLQPGNFIALQVVPPGWDYDCFGIPLEVVQSMNADFDGDECNLYLVPNVQSQAECATILNPAAELGCFVTQGTKLAPSQDMLVAYYLKYDEIDFLPYKNPDLAKTFRVLYDLEGSQRAFEYIDRLRLFYLDLLENDTCFGLTLEEMENLSRWGRSQEEFEAKAKFSNGCLVTQVLSGAKGSLPHLYQMFGAVGYQNGVDIGHSFWEGLECNEMIHHAIASTEALSKMCKIWEPGYGYSKMIHIVKRLTVDYLGHLMDGETVIENDVLDVMHFTDVLSVEGFQQLKDKVLV